MQKNAAQSANVAGVSYAITLYPPKLNNNKLNYIPTNPFN